MISCQINKSGKYEKKAYKVMKSDEVISFFNC